MNRTRVKYCGLTTEQDIDAAIACGVDAVGFVYVPKSPRFITAKDSMPLIQKAQQAGMTAVALFADQAADVIADTVKLVKPDVIQFHGQESAAFCEQFGIAYWKAVPMLTNNDFEAYIKDYHTAKAYLLDAFGAQQSGGSGQSFDWFQIPPKWRDSMILAGGINANNVHAALSETSAKYIDTSSGIEQSPGVKSVTKMHALMDAVKSFDNQKN